MIYDMEPLAYYLGLRPNEFWHSRYKDIYLFCKMNMMRMSEDFKQHVILQEAVTDKLIQADSMSKKPKIIPLRKIFKGLFSEGL